MTLPLSGCTFGWLPSAGRGEVDFPAFAAALTETGFRGPTVYELVDGQDPEPRLPADLATLAAAGWAA